MSEAGSLILASASPYRRALLERLGIPFEIDAASIDETIASGESPEGAVARLAREKARAVAERRPGAVVIGSDQVAALGSEILGKPGSEERAREQLSRYSGQCVRFLTAVCVCQDSAEEHLLETVQVRFRSLDAETIERYVRADHPLDCAGAIRSEGLGAALLESVESNDPSALIGLPLIGVARLLRDKGYRLP
ncbi:MAG: Maf family nucleotide pyrophosphatase [Halorhodospira halophila]|uniref:Maf family protein n=1 Tax=Halorhodospira TaxID=85108 RepID=UPI0019119468|nr:MULTISPECIES: nucleoside triphosphate pyrophosphatase [Halorhodospira]MBK5936864.1 septum formation protein Maf [Halorhodospira halophila]MBK5942309.1 septum formation protein Maf [Halorhodospira halophila]MCC3750350.1 Maf family nucleotide pyrophosphatase [Halorhodospira halophila]MCG5528091.1 Maf family nucleotide pyrophosphatase [Halorhodospira halophila]MCG5531860.1 Maf family nucleotide pyrophosphatase [Halorhodospira sp. 9621]